MLTLLAGEQEVSQEVENDVEYVLVSILDISSLWLQSLQSS